MKSALRIDTESEDFSPNGDVVGVCNPCFSKWLAEHGYERSKEEQVKK
jgi:hypothetical protein